MVVSNYHDYNSHSGRSTMIPPTPTNTPTATPQNLCLGDLVFLDLDNNGIYEVSDGEFGIDGVKLNLYRDTDGNGVLSAGDTLVASTVSAGGGLYHFCGLTAGNYIVEVASSAFDPGQILEDLQSSSGNDVAGMAPDPDNDTDNDDNGMLVAGFGVATKAVTLTPNGEPGVGIDGDGPNGNQTVDFGFRTKDRPTAAQLAGLSLTVVDDRVHLNWSTSFEDGLLGFNVYRSDRPNGPCAWGDWGDRSIVTEITVLPSV